MGWTKKLGTKGWRWRGGLLVARLAATAAEQLAALKQAEAATAMIEAAAET